MADTSFAALRARLEALPDSGHEPPNVDPRAAALAAVMVCEFVAKEGVRKRFQRVGESGELDVAHIADLNLVARGVLQIVPKLGRQDGSLSLPPAPTDALTAGRALVASMLAVVLASADEIPDARALAEYVKLGDDAVETAQNLRLLAEFYREYSEILASVSAKHSDDDADKASTLARSIDASIAATDSPERKEWRRWLMRAWPLLETAYDEVCRAGRFIFHRERPLFKFPPLLSVGSTSRRLKRSETAAGTSAAAQAAPPASAPKPAAPPPAAAPAPKAPAPAPAAAPRAPAPAAAASAGQTDALEKDWFKKAPIMVNGRPITLPSKPKAPPARPAAPVEVQRDPFKAMLSDADEVPPSSVERDPFAAPPPASTKAGAAAEERISFADAPTPIPEDDEASAIEAALASVPTQEAVVEVDVEPDPEPITAREPGPDAPPEPVKRKGPPSKLPPRKPPLPPRKAPVAEAAPPSPEPPPALEPEPKAVEAAPDSGPVVEAAPVSSPVLEISAGSEPAPPPPAKPSSAPPPSASPAPVAAAPSFDPILDLGAELAAEFGSEDFVPPPPASVREAPPSVREPALPPPKPAPVAAAEPAAAPARTTLTSAASAAERRRGTAPRFRVTLKLTLTSDDDIGMGATENLSESGAFIATPLPRASGSKLALIIAHPETGDILKLEALVRWGRPARRGVGLEAGMGVEFIDVTDEQRALIKQMIAP